MPTDPATVPPLTDADTITLREFLAGHRSSLDGYSIAHHFPPTGGQWDITIGLLRRLAVSRVDTAEVERRAASKAFVAAWKDAAWCSGSRAMEAGESRDRYIDAACNTYLAREYPAPAPRECVLSDGSVVTRGSDDYYRRCGGQPTAYGLIARHWVEVLRAPDTGDDFEKVKAFAAEVGQ